MEAIKRVFVFITSVVLIGVVLYVIYISLNAQKEREEPGWQSQKTPQEEVKPTPPPEKGETELPPSPQAEKPSQLPGIPDTIRWNKVPAPAETPVVSGKFPPGNPNPIFISAAKRILPAVVTIKSTMKVKGVPNDFYHRFFKDKKEEGGDDDEGIYRDGTGSGILISSDGFIMTNNHVIENSASYTVTLYDKREYSARYVGADPNTDIGLLKVEAKDLPAAFIGNSDSVQIGEWVMAVGSPLNFTSTITAGIISALGRDINIIDGNYKIENFIQTDAVINPGNSGGALVNLKGEVIGVNTAIATRTGLYQGYGFAIPSNLAKKIVNDLVRYGEVRRGLLGVSIGAVDDASAKGLGLPAPTGAFIQGLTPDSPAEKAGLKVGDVILAINGEKVTSVNDLQTKIAQHHPGDIVDVEIWRNKHRRHFNVELGMAPVARDTGNEEMTKPHTYKNLGLKTRDLTSEEKQELDLEGGALIESITPGSPASRSNLFPTEVIISVDDTPVTDSDTLDKKLNSLKRGQVVKVKLRRLLANGETDDRIAFVEVE